jgi:uncharacterized protein YcbX
MYFVSQRLAITFALTLEGVFMLLKVLPDGYKYMAVSSFSDMTQFLTSIQDRKDGKAVVNVTFRASGNEEKSRTLSIPLMPDTEKLEPFNVDMYGATAAAFKMPHEYNAWFSECFGYQVVLVFQGDNKRDVQWKDLVQTQNASRLARVPLLGSAIPQTPQITFADCAPYLVVSSTSLDNVSSRLAPDEPMDVTKFRPNIVLSGADEAWEEDYWSKVRIGSIELIMKHNCVRCASVNVDYETGKPGTGVAGQVLKKLQKDRRVDKGAKWSPVFGRYAFWKGAASAQVFRVGDEAVVIDRNKDRTVFSSLPRSEHDSLCTDLHRLARHRMKQKGPIAQGEIAFDQVCKHLRIRPQRQCRHDLDRFLERRLRSFVCRRKKWYSLRRYGVKI